MIYECFPTDGFLQKALINIGCNMIYISQFVNRTIQMVTFDCPYQTTLRDAMLLSKWAWYPGLGGFQNEIPVVGNHSIKHYRNRSEHEYNHSCSFRVNSRWNHWTYLIYKITLFNNKRLEALDQHYHPIMMIEGLLPGGMLPLEDASKKEIIDNPKWNLICTSDSIKNK